MTESVENKKPPVTASGLNIKEELMRPTSPDSHCPICLEDLQNKSFTNTCLHQFCFSCLLEWAKVKPECPLCKQGFQSILHNIRSMEDYDEHSIDYLQSSGMEPTVLINLAFQRHRFRYRTTMGASAMLYIENFADVIPLPTGNSHNPINFRPNDPLFSSYNTRSSSTYPCRVGTTEFRRNVYRQGLWVRRNTNETRVRESSPEFYRLNPAQTHRLVPWLNRELLVLLDVSFDTHRVCQEILSLITVVPINSSCFHDAVRPYIGPRTSHFIHEFYSYATSPRDMESYDINSTYSSVNTATDRVISDTDSDSDVEVVFEDIPRAVLNNRCGYGCMVNNCGQSSAGPSGIQSRLDESVIEIGSSSEGENPLNIEDDSDSVEIINTLPPKHLRTPEIITIDETDDDDIPFLPVSYMAPVPIPPEIEVTPPEIKVYEKAMLETTRRSRRDVYYKDESTSSDEDGYYCRKKSKRSKRKSSTRKSVKRKRCSSFSERKMPRKRRVKREPSCSSTRSSSSVSCKREVSRTPSPPFTSSFPSPDRDRSRTRSRSSRGSTPTSFSPSSEPLPGPSSRAEDSSPSPVSTSKPKLRSVVHLVKSESTDSGNCKARRCRKRWFKERYLYYSSDSDSDSTARSNNGEGPV